MIKSFVKKAQKTNISGPFSITLDNVQKNNPQLLEHLQNLSETQIKKIINSRDFVPLDFIALVGNANKASFFKVIQDYVYRVLRQNALYKTWISEIGKVSGSDDTNDEVTKDIAGKITEQMLREDDPMKMGILKQVLLEGSRASSYQYETEDNPIKRKELRNSLSPNDDKVMVPFCPADKACGKKWSLWEIAKSEDGSYKTEDINPLTGEAKEDKKGVKFDNKVDENGRCLSTESIKSIELQPQDIEEIFATSKSIESSSNANIFEVEQQKNTYLVVSQSKSWLVELSDRQNQHFEQKYRDFWISPDEELYFRCTYQANLPSFASFFSYNTVRSEMTKIWNKFKKDFGRDIDIGKLNQFIELKAKKESQALTEEEKQKYNQLLQYKQKKESEQLSRVVSLDRPVGEEKDQSLHEKITSEDVEEEEFSQEQAEVDIERHFSTEEQQLIEQAKKSHINFLKAIQKYLQHIKINTGKKKTQWNMSEYNQMVEILKQVASDILTNQQEQRQCLICKNLQSREQERCVVALSLPQKIHQIYVESDSQIDFISKMRQLSPKQLKHIEFSNIIPFVEDIYAQQFQVDSDDALDLSEISSSQDKISLDEFKSTLEQKMTQGQRRGWQGLLIDDAKVEIDQTTINLTAEKLKHLITKADAIDISDDPEEEQTLLRQLATYYKS